MEWLGARLTVLIFGMGLVGCNGGKPSHPIIDYAAQQDESLARQCADSPFKLRKFPFTIVEITVTSQYGDPNNSFIGSDWAKCVDGSLREHLVCGVVARRNSVGYISDARKFFGTYYFDAGRFDLAAIGVKAEKLCKENGFF